MMPITVQGVGVVGGFGNSLSDLTQALETGQTQPSVLSVPTGTGTIDLTAFRTNTELLKDFVPPRALRRMDAFSQMGLLAAHLALADAGLNFSSDATSGLGRLGVIIASGYGATATTYSLLDSINNDGDDCTSPTLFASSLHNVCSANISIGIGATGPNLTVSQFDLSVQSALLTARQWLDDGRVDRVLFGAVDELSDLIGYIWYRKRGETTPGTMCPLRTQAESAIPGEGAAFLVLSRVQESQPGYCTLDAVSTGRCLPQEIIRTAPGSELLLLGADGRKELGVRYSAQATGQNIACFTPLYGCMPAAPAFDLVVGALMLKNGQEFQTPQASSCDFPATVAGISSRKYTKISCLTLAEDDGYGLIELGPISDKIQL